MAKFPATPVTPASASLAPASVPADSPGRASSEKPDATLAPQPRPDADATTAAPTRSADAPDAIGPGSDSTAQQPGGTVDGGSGPGREAINFDDDEIYSGRGKGAAATGGTDAAEGGDSGRLGPPSEQLSSHNRPREHKP